jgi:predicted metal-dependent hydrolase
VKTQFDIPGAGTVNIRRGGHIKTLSIRVARGRTPWINIPAGKSDREAEAFLMARRQWLVDHLNRLQTSRPATGTFPAINTAMQTKFHTLRVLPPDNGATGCRREGSEVRLFVPADAPVEWIAPVANRLLSEICRRECNAWMPGRVRELADRHGFSHGRLTFRDNLTNWGSCSRDNNISLNIQLMRLPDDVIDYVILHELCHTVEKNHSPRFWSLVRAACPGFVEARRQLKTFHTRC